MKSAHHATSSDSVFQQFFAPLADDGVCVLEIAVEEFLRSLGTHHLASVWIPNLYSQSLRALSVVDSVVDDLGGCSKFDKVLSVCAFKFT